MFNFFKKKPEKKPERTDLFKGIKVFVYYTNEMYLSYLKYHIENVSTEIKIVYFTDLEQMIKGMTEQKPNFLITILFGLKGLSAFDRSELQDIVKKLKSASNSGNNSGDNSGDNSKRS